MRIFLCLVAIFLAPIAFAATNHQALKRVVVFPLQVEAEYKSLADEVWWNLRAKLTDSKRFLVASRNFMEAKGVFQSRGKLEPADAIILGKLLDAHALVTLSLADRTLILRAYEGRDGYLLLERTIELHPSLPLSKQLPSMSEKLMLDFIASIPYQGVVVADTLVGRAVYKNGDLWRVKAEVGTNVRVSVGDKVQLMDLQVISLDPAFGKGGEVKILAEGKVIELKDQIITVDMDRVPDVAAIKEGTLVRVPTELQRLQETYSMGGSQLLNELPLDQTGRPLTEEEVKRKPVITSLSFIANIVLMLIVAL